MATPASKSSLVGVGGLAAAWCFSASVLLRGLRAGARGGVNVGAKLGAATVMAEGDGGARDRR